MVGMPFWMIKLFIYHTSVHHSGGCERRGLRGPRGGLSVRRLPARFLVSQCRLERGVQLVVMVTGAVAVAALRAGVVGGLLQPQQHVHLKKGKARTDIYLSTRLRVESKRHYEACQHQTMHRHHFVTVTNDFCFKVLELVRSFPVVCVCSLYLCYIFSL